MGNAELGCGCRDTLPSSGTQLSALHTPQQRGTHKPRGSNNVLGAAGSSKGLMNKENFQTSNYVQLGRVTTARDRISVCILREDKYHRWVILMCSDSRESLNKRRSLCGYQKIFLHLLH